MNWELLNILKFTILAHFRSGYLCSFTKFTCIFVTSSFMEGKLLKKKFGCFENQHCFCCRNSALPSHFHLFRCIGRFRSSESQSLWQFPPQQREPLFLVVPSPVARASLFGSSHPIWVLLYLFQILFIIAFALSFSAFFVAYFRLLVVFEACGAWGRFQESSFPLHH